MCLLCITDFLAKRLFSNDEFGFSASTLSCLMVGVIAKKKTFTMEGEGWFKLNLIVKSKKILRDLWF